MPFKHESSINTIFKVTDVVSRLTHLLDMVNCIRDPTVKQHLQLILIWILLEFNFSPFMLLFVVFVSSKSRLLQVYQRKVCAKLEAQLEVHS